MKIGELARLTGTNVETIRYYERDGLLPIPARSDGNYRIYGDAHVQRLELGEALQHVGPDHRLRVGARGGGRRRRLGRTRHLAGDGL